jgi:hypothetical protein
MKIVIHFQRKKFPLGKIAKRDYYRQKKNPLFFIFFFLSICFAIYFLIFSPVCKVKPIIEIEDNNLVNFKKEEVEKIIKEISKEKYFFFIQKDSLILFPTKKLKEFFIKDSRIEEFKIEKEPPNFLKINLKIFKPEAVLFDFDQKYYLINQNGKKIIEINFQPDLVLIENRIKEKKDFESVINFFKETNKIFDFKIVKIEIYQDKGVELDKAITSEGWEIYFDGVGDIKKQVDNLSLVIREKIKDRKNLSYIDLRFGNRIFYK